MKKISIAVLFVCYTAMVSAQTATGLLSANAYTGKIISQYDGTYFWTIHNGTYSVVDAQGTTQLQNLGIKNPFQPANNNDVIRNGIFTDYDKKTRKLRFMSIADKKPLTEYVFETIIPYSNGTYFAVKTIAQSKEFIYYDENLKVLYKTSPKRIAQQLKISLRDYNLGGVKYRKFFGSYNDGLIKLYNPKTRTYGFVNAKGTVVIPPRYKSVGDFSEGYAFFKNDDNMYGFINTKGETVIPPMFSKQPYNFSSDRAKVISKDGFFGYIDSAKNLVIDAQYRFATNFYKGHALVRKEKHTSILLIDTSGTVIKEFDPSLKIAFQEQASTHQTLGLKVEYLTYINPVLKQLVDFKKGIFDKGKYKTTGLIDLNGTIILDFKYKSLKDYHDGKLLAIFEDTNKKEQQALIREDGTIVVKVQESKF